MLETKAISVYACLALLLSLLCSTTGKSAHQPLSNKRQHDIDAELTDCLVQHSIPFVDPDRNSTAVYFQAAQSDNVRFHFHPMAIAFPGSTAQVSQVVKCARENGNVQTVARSGGHSFAGYSSGGQDGALIVDLANMTSIAPDLRKGTVTVQPGARLGDVIKALWQQGKRGTSHGTCPTVGIGGHALCGGFGPTSRKWGMTTDNIVGATVVLANGTAVQTSQDQQAHLFWGLRGAGSYFGIVTELTIKTFDVDHPTTFLEYRWTSSLQNLDDMIKLLEGIQSFALWDKLPAELGFHIQARPPGRNDPPGGTIAVHMRGLFLGPKDILRRQIMPQLWRELESRGLPGQPDSIIERESSYLHVMEDWDDFGSPSDKLDTIAERARHNNFVQRTSLTLGQRGFSSNGFETLLRAFWQQADDERTGRSARRANMPHNQFWNWNVYLELYGGANNRLRDDDVRSQSSLVHRDGLWLIQASVGTYEDVPLVHAAYAHLLRVNTAIIQALQQDHIQRGSFSCYIDPTLEEWKSLYYGNAVTQLTQLKYDVDPTNLFRTPQSLIETPSAISSSDVNWVGNVHPLP